MYLEGNNRRFLLSAKKFDSNVHYISLYESFATLAHKPKIGYFARVERQRDSSYLVSLDYCHLCDEKLGKFCCGRGLSEREVVAKVKHSVKKYRPVNMEFRSTAVTIPTISKNGTRKVWCPTSFRKINSALSVAADVNEALIEMPRMGSKLISKLPDWNPEAENLVVRFRGGGRILVASSKNFLLYDAKYAVLDFAEQSVTKSRGASAGSTEDHSERISQYSVQTPSKATAAKSKLSEAETNESSHLDGGASGTPPPEKRKIRKKSSRDLKTSDSGSVGSKSSRSVSPNPSRSSKDGSKSVAREGVQDAGKIDC
jgi:hypothetical protein